MVEAALAASVSRAPCSRSGTDGALGAPARLRPARLRRGRAEVRPDTIYDLASLTKVIATTTAAMILVDEGRLDLDKPVASFLPGFHGGAKDRVTVRQLLTHSSGIDWWAPLYKELSGPDGLRRADRGDGSRLRARDASRSTATWV